MFPLACGGCAGQSPGDPAGPDREGARGRDADQMQPPGDQELVSPPLRSSGAREAPVGFK